MTDADGAQETWMIDIGMIMSMDYLRKAVLNVFRAHYGQALLNTRTLANMKSNEYGSERPSSLPGLQITQNVDSLTSKFVAEEDIQGTWARRTSRSRLISFRVYRSLPARSC